MRRRTDDDLDGCDHLAGAVHALDGYPPYLPTDLHRFLAAPDALAAWVAVDGTELFGHVALHPASSVPVMDLASRASGRSPKRLAVVARLLVSPTARRRGVGRSLLSAAVDEAARRDLWPVLDVATHYHAAISLYERCGWWRAGQVTVDLGGATLDEFVYIAQRSPTTESTLSFDGICHC